MSPGLRPGPPRAAGRPPGGGHGTTGRPTARGHGVTGTVRDRGSRPGTGRKVAGLVTSALFLAATAAVMAVTLRGQDWHRLAALGHPRAVAALGAALVLNLAGLVLSMLSWRCLLVELAGPVGALASCRIYFTGLVSALLPGSVWAVAVHARLGAAAGISAARMAAVYVASLPVGILAGASAGLLLVPELPGAQVAWVVVPAAVLALCLCRPSLVGKLAAVVLRRRRPAPVPGGVIRRSILANLAGWAVSGLHLWLIVLVLGGPAWRSLPLCIGGFALAVTAGGLAFVVPNGIGVRDVILSLALASVLPWPSAVAAAIASRVVVLFSEAVAAAASLLATWGARRWPHAR